MGPKETTTTTTEAPPPATAPATHEPPNPSRFELYAQRLGVNPNLIMLKVTLFMMYGATSALIPFLTIHMQSVGLTVEEIAVIYLILPFTTFLSPPITGYLVDKFGHYKLVMVCALLLNGIFHHSLTFIPQMETPGAVPMAYVFRHPETGKVEVWWSPCTSRECPDEEEWNMVLDDCYDHCLLRNATGRAPSILTGIHQSIAVRPPTFVDKPPSSSKSGCEGSSSGNSNFGQPSNLNFHIQKNSTNTKVKGGGAPWSKQRGKGGGGAGEVAGAENATSKEEEAAFFLLDMHPHLMEPQDTLGLELEPDDNETVNDFRQHFSKELLEAHGVNFFDLEDRDLRCGGFVMATNLTYDTLKEMASDCMLQKCSFREGGPEVCPPDYIESADHVFWIYFFLRFLANFMLSASVTAMDPIALDMIQQYGGEFGRERLFATFGMAIFSPLSGLLIDYRSKKLGYTDYSGGFYTYSALMVVSALSVMLMPIGTKMPADDLMRGVLDLLKMPHIMLFIIFMFGLGNCWGFIETYLFLYLKQLGSSNSLLGITVTVGTMSSVPFLYGADRLIKKLGHVNIIIIAFFTHAARLVGYSYIEDAWWCFPFEAMEALSVHLMWVAAATYCGVIAPNSLRATLIGVLGMAHYSLGKGSGSFSGGFLIANFGTRQAFRLMGLGSVAAGIVYALLHFFWLHKYSEDRDTFKEQHFDSAEVEKLQTDEEAERPDINDSIERLSLMIRFNHRGSITSLGDHQRVGSRRNSSISLTRGAILRSAHDVYHRTSTSSLHRRTSTPQLSKNTSKGDAVTPPGGRKTHNNLPAPSTEEFRNRSNSIKEEEEVSPQLEVVA